jgi:hypothetical protein
MQWGSILKTLCSYLVDLLRRDAHARDVVVKDASAEALFPHQPQFQPPPRLAPASAQPASADGAAQASAANGNTQVRP